MGILDCLNLTTYYTVSHDQGQRLYHAFLASIAAHVLTVILTAHKNAPLIHPEAALTVILAKANPTASSAAPIPPMQPIRTPMPKIKGRNQSKNNTTPPVQAVAKTESVSEFASSVTQEVSPINAAITPDEKINEAPSKPTSLEPPQVPIENQQLKAEYGVLLAQEIAKHKQYPMLARKTKQQGNVVLQVQITGLGKLIDAQVYQSSGYALLDNQAMDMVKKATPFSQPPSNLGNSDLTLLVPVSFRLN
jgi:protein TonB